MHSVLHSIIQSSLVQSQTVRLNWPQCFFGLNFLRNKVALWCECQPHMCKKCCVEFLIQHVSMQYCWPPSFETTAASFIQVYQSRWLQAAQLLAHLLQNHQQHTSAAAHPAHPAEAASQSGSPQTGTVYIKPLNTLPLHCMDNSEN